MKNEIFISVSIKTINISTLGASLSWSTILSEGGNAIPALKIKTFNQTVHKLKNKSVDKSRFVEDFFENENENVLSIFLNVGKLKNKAKQDEVFPASTE